MGREFTNVLYAKPLWIYAIDVYSENKAEFLLYQDQHRLCVNDLIILGFCLGMNLAPNDNWWSNENTIALRDIISGLRQLRNSPCNATHRPTLLKVELDCEKIDLQTIACQFQLKQNWSMQFDAYCDTHLVENKPKLEQFIRSLTIKKGAEAP
jgi:hypothetical protein